MRTEITVTLTSQQVAYIAQALLERRRQCEADIQQYADVTGDQEAVAIARDIVAHARQELARINELLAALDLRDHVTSNEYPVKGE